MLLYILFFFFFSSRRRHTRWNCDWSSDVCSSDLTRRSESARARALISECQLRKFAQADRGCQQHQSGESERLAPQNEGERSEERRVGKECRSRWSPDQ